MITFKQSGNLNKTEDFLRTVQTGSYLHILDRYGKLGVEALASATPIDSGDTASAWDYKIIQSKTGAKLVWTNSNVVDDVPIAILIQYGHTTRDGSYIQGRDFINPALKPIFDKILDDIWREVIK